MNYDPIHFTHSLLSEIADQLSIQYLGTPRALWLGTVRDTPGVCAPVYTVATQYSGPGKFIEDGQERINVQWATYGEYSAALQRSRQVEAMFLAEDNSARVLWSFPALHPDEGGGTAADVVDGMSQWQLVTVRLLSRSGIVERREDGRVKSVFNTTLSFRRHHG